jgi:membrane fusion protein, multidrug efflux system
LLKSVRAQRPAVIAVLALSSLLRPSPLLAATPPPPAVTVARVVKQNVAPKHVFVGRVDAMQSVQLHAMVQGVLQQVVFKEGADVTEGQLLFVIDPNVYQAQLDGAQAALAKAEATLKNDQLTVARQQQLVRQQAAPQQTLDTAVATRDADAATVKAAEAQVRTAQINLGYTQIKAPISGRIGAATITKGNLVSTSTGPLATIVQLDPIRVVFSVDASSLVTAEQQRGSSVHELTKEFLPKIKFSNGTIYDQAGELSFVSNQVDAATGTIPIYASFPNSKNLLLPGQYVSVVVQPSTAEERILVPVAAVQQDKQGKFVLVVGPDNKVVQQRFEATRQIDQSWVVDEGLNEGQNVIVNGIQKAHAGQTVNPQSSESPAASSSGGASSRPAGH